MKSADSWHVQHLRATLFRTAAPESIEGNDWWERLTGKQPDSKRLEPKTQRYVAVGEFMKGELLLAENPLRLDWLYSLAQNTGEAIPGKESSLSAGGVEEQLDESVPSLGPYSEALGHFLPLVKSGLELDDLPDVRRMAFGAALIQPASSLQEANTTIAAYLPTVSFDTSTVRDFIYRINRPTVSKIYESLEINRLATWQVERSIQMLGAVVAGKAEILKAGHSSSVRCKLELDINSSASNEDSLSASRLSDLFAEIVEVAERIAQKGERE